MKQKRSKLRKEEVIRGEDRISGLPDSLLIEILSSLTTQSAVRTCVLSKRWRYLWTSLPDLHFDRDEFDCWDRFELFINQVFSLRDNAVAVRKFSLSCLFYEPSIVESCICYAACHKVQQLHLYPLNRPFQLPPRSRYGFETFEFPHCFLNCETLVSLRLDNYRCRMPVDKSLCLPALKTLHLEHFTTDSFDFITGTVGGSPNLEILLLDCVSVGDHMPYPKLIITAPQLRKFRLYSGRFIQCCYELEVVISAPILTSFEVAGNFSPVFSMGNLPFLKDASVHVWPRVEFYDDESIERNQRMPLNVIKLLAQLREAKFISLSLAILEVLARDPEYLGSHPSPFHKLKRLKLIRQNPHLALPLNVVNYLTQGTSCGNTMKIYEGSLDIS